MTLDILHFIDGKGGNAQEIRESQRKRGLSVELVDEIIQMYNEWVKSTLIKNYLVWTVPSCELRFVVDFDANGLSKQVNAVQKEIAAKKKVQKVLVGMMRVWLTVILQAKESADDLVAQKKELDAQVAAKRAETKEFEIKMRQKASTVGNIVGKDVPVSLTEVCILHVVAIIAGHHNANSC